MKESDVQKRVHLALSRAKATMFRSNTGQGWVGPPDGLRLEKECRETAPSKWQCLTKQPTLPPVWATEQEFFTWLGVHYVEPHYRNV